MLKLCIIRTYAKPSRLEHGHSILELGMLSVLFVVISVFCLDVGFVLMGSQLNERACRDAARAAAQSDNATTSLLLAQRAVLAHRADGYFVSDPIVQVAAFQYIDFGGDPPPDTSPFVSVTTACDVRIPAPVVFIGAKFGENGTMRFTKTYTFPIVKTQLYL